MTMWLSQSDVDNLLHFATLSAALKLKIPNAEILAPAVLSQEVQKASSAAHSALSAFRSAYKAWFQFHAQIDAAGRAGQLTSQETGQLVQLSGNVDSSRQHFIDVLAKL